MNEKNIVDVEAANGHPKQINDFSWIPKEQRRRILLLSDDL